jgi:hypothetical protein
MYARRIVPILLIAGAVMMITRHHHDLTGERAQGGEKRRPIGPHGEWGKRVPPLFDAKRWHQRAHEQAAQQPAAI